MKRWIVLTTAITFIIGLGIAGAAPVKLGIIGFQMSAETHARVVNAAEKKAKSLGWEVTVLNSRGSIPDLAERWELGLNMNLESTDRDKFDDGQELFGLTYCPGSGGYCGYGVLPRNEDWGVIFAQMPSWVAAPGNHPLVAAFPVIEINVVPSSLNTQFNSFCMICSFNHLM